ncbi:7705_t:CDS:2, partial [Scutellospora calospora]
MSKIKNSLFDSIFLETHSELETLNDELNELYEVYQTNNLKDDSDSDDDIDNKDESITSEEGQEDNVNDNITFEEDQEDDAESSIFKMNVPVSSFVALLTTWCHLLIGLLIRQS